MWFKKTCIYNVHLMEYYSALKRKEILTHATTWRDPGNITLSEMSQAQMDKYCTIPLISGI